MRPPIPALVLLLAVALPTAGAGDARAQAPEPPAADDPALVDYVEHLGEIIPGDIVLRDEAGAPIRLEDFVDKPTILFFVYYQCPGICTPLLNEVADILGKSRLDPAETPFQLLTVSFEPKDTPELAAAKRENYLKLVGRPLPPETWRFFTAAPEDIARLTRATGFNYKRAGSEYVHPGGLIILSPERKIVRYLFGIQFLPFDFRMGVFEAAQGTVRPTTARLLQFCYSYDPEGRTYAFNLARVVGSVMLVSVVFFVIFLYFSTRRRRREEA